MMRTSPRPARIAMSLAIAAALAVAGCGSDSPDTLLKKARTAMDARDATTAEIHLKNLLRQRPEDGEARVMLATVYAAVGNTRSAEKEWLRALELNVPADRALPGLVEARVQLGDAKGALEAAGKWTATGRDAVAEVAYWQGRAFAMSEQPQKAEQAWRDTLAARPDDGRAQVALLGLRASRGEAAAVEKELDAMLAARPEQFEALMLKSELQATRADTAGMRDTLARAIKAQPRAALPRLRLVSLLIDAKEYDAARTQHAELKKLAGTMPLVVYLGALLDFRTDKLDAARDALTGLMNAQPDFLPALALAAHVALKQDALESAETFARRLTERAPRSVQGAKLLAGVLLRRNDVDKALRTAVAALEKNPNDAALLALAGEAALRSNDVEGATRYFERAARLDADNPDVRTGLGLARVGAGRVDAGIADLVAASMLDPKSTRPDLALVSMHLRAGRFADAIAAIDRLEGKQPGTALASNLRGTARLGTGDGAAARADFEEALRRDAAFFPAVANLAELDAREGKPAAAVERLQAFVRAQPRNAPAVVALARAMGRAGSGKEDVIAVLQKSVEANPTAKETAVELARLQLEAGRAPAAVTALRDAASHNPDDRAVLETLAVAYQRAGQNQQALETREKLLRLDPDSAPLHLRMAELKAALGDPPGAALSLRKAISLDRNLASAQQQVATALLKAGKADEAQRLAETLAREMPGNPAGRTLEGDVAAANGQWTDAANAYRKALALQRSTPLVIKAHQALRRSGRAAEGDALLREALQATPGDVPLRLYAGEVAIAAGDWRTTAAHYEVVAKADPGNVIALNNLAWALNEVGDARAVKFAEEAYRRAPGNAAIADTLGVVLVARGDARKGLETLKQAMVLAPGVPQYALHYASAAAKAGDTAAARAAIEDVVKRFPGTPHAAKAVELGRTL